jgi:hypothetical protein
VRPTRTATACKTKSEFFAELTKFLERLGGLSRVVRTCLAKPFVATFVHLLKATRTFVGRAVMMFVLAMFVSEWVPTKRIAPKGIATKRSTATAT